MVIHIIPSFSNTPITVHHTKWASMLFTQNLKFIEIWTIRFTLLYNVAFLNGRFICKYSSVYFVHVRLLYRRPKVLVFSFICFRVNHAEDNQWKLIENILRRHPCIIGGRNPYSWKDITDGKQFPEIEKNTLYFTINTDGVSPIDSRNLHVWPVIMSLVNLHPRLRRLSCNLVLMSLYVGMTKPEWSQIIPLINAQILSGLEINGKHYTCKVVCLIADMPAKSSICNVQGHSAR